MTTAAPRYPVARQLFARLTQIGLVLAILTGTAQLAVEYRRDMSALQARLDQIESSYLPIVIENAWLEDLERLDILADGIQGLPEIAHVVLHAPDGSILAEAGQPASRPLTRSFILTRDYSGRTIDLGRLEVTAGLEFVRERALSRLWLSLAGNAVLVFALAALLYGQVHQLMTRRLKSIVAYARRLGAGLPAQLAPEDLARQDEFGDLGRTLTRMHQDVSAAHAALSASEGRYHELFTSSPVSLWEEDFSAVKAELDALRPDVTELPTYLDANPDFIRRCAGLVRVLDVNDASLALHRAQDRSELLSRLSAIFTPASYDAFRCQLEAIFDNRYDLTLDTQVRTLDGDVVDAVVHWHVPPSHRHDCSRVIVSQEDVTALKAARRSSDITLERLMQANAELERFTFVASHDLQEPVRAVFSFAQLLERHLRQEGGLSQDSQDFLGFLRAAAERMQGQVAGLQAYARAGQGLSAIGPVALDDALADARALLGDALTGCDLRMETLPVVVGDRSLLAQLFRQLLDNAVKFRRPDRELEIAITAMAESGNWRITLRDNGIGIDPAYAATVFEVFRRLHGPAKYPGAGIGLAVCRRIIERHGGTIAIDTRVKDGTAVTFTLPASDLATAGAAQ